MPFGLIRAESGGMLMDGYGPFIKGPEPVGHHLEVLPRPVSGFQRELPAGIFIIFLKMSESTAKTSIANEVRCNTNG